MNPKAQQIMEEALLMLDESERRGMALALISSIEDPAEKMRLLDHAHDKLSDAECDHHEIRHCRCAVALEWGALKDAPRT